MILVDTPVWIDHFHRTDADLVALLESTSVTVHPLVLTELALGSLRDRGVLELLAALPRVLRAADDEVLAFIERRRLWSQGLSAVDVSLLTSVAITPETRLWTRDKRLAAAARRLGLEWSPSTGGTTA